VFGLLESASVGPVQQLLVDLLDDAGYGIFIVDPHSAITFCNQSAHKCLAPVGIEISGSRLHHEAHNAAGMQLRAAIKLGQSGKKNLSLVGKKEQRIAVALTPIQSQSEMIPCSVLVAIERYRICGSESLNAYSTLLKLTATEARVVQLLSTSHDPKEVARQLGVAVATVRSHIQSILEKAEIKSLREFLLKLARLPTLAGTR
jgi:DNA-binding CsgD family transcriptional regulator